MVEAPRFEDSRHVNVIRLSAVHTGYFYTQEIFLVFISFRDGFDLRAIVQPEGFISMKISNDTVGKRTREFPVCGAVPQPAAPPLTCKVYSPYFIVICEFSCFKVFTALSQKRHDFLKKVIEMCVLIFSTSLV